MRRTTRAGATTVEADDFGEAFTPELREQLERLRDKTEATLSR